MILGRLIALVICFIPAMVLAVVCKKTVDSMMLTIPGLTPFETAMVMIIPYLVLVYGVFIKPVVDFWQSTQNRGQPGQPGQGGNYE